MAENAPYRVLALKYRPQTFSDVVGQRHVVRQLQGEINDRRVGHAYLFCGPRGVGKTSMARIFAKALNCVEGPTAHPCGKCTHCLGIANDSDLDVIEVDAATYNKREETTELLEGIDRATFSARYKVYIIDEVHMFSVHSFNVLLKRLEEPPPQVVFILATTNPEKLPETVISRCRRLEFERFETQEIVGRLEEIAAAEGISIEPKDRAGILESIALASEGGMRDAQVAFDQLISLAESGNVTMESARQLLGVVESELLHDLLQGLADRDTRKCLMVVHGLVEKGRDLQKFIRTFGGYLRDGMLLKANAPAELLKVARGSAESLRALVDRMPYPHLLNMVQQFLDLEEKMRGAAPARFLLEFAIIKLTAIQPRFVLDAIDPRRIDPAAAGSEPVPARTAKIEPIAPPPPMQQAAIMREPEPASPAPLADIVMESEPAPAASVPVPPSGPPSPRQVAEFIKSTGEKYATFPPVLEAARIRFSGDTMLIELAPADAIMRRNFDDATKAAYLREAARKAFGRPFAIRAAVGTVAEDRPSAAAVMHDNAPIPRTPLPIAYDDPYEAENPVAAPEPKAGKLTFAEALARYPDLKDAVDLVRQHLGAQPWLFNGQRV